MAFILGGFSHLFAFKGAFQAEVRASSRETRRRPASFEFRRRRRRENRDAGDDWRAGRVTTTTQVVVGENENGESAIRRFRKAVMSSGHIQEVRALAATTTTTTTRRRRWRWRTHPLRA
jgi:ribosomal protein S21